MCLRDCGKEESTTGERESSRDDRKRENNHGNYSSCWNVCLQLVHVVLPSVVCASAIAIYIEFHVLDISFNMCSASTYMGLLWSFKIIAVQIEILLTCTCVQYMYMYIHGIAMVV